MTSTQTIGVIGAGSMGTGIAQTCVVAGFSLVMSDLDKERVTRGRDAIANALNGMLKKGADCDAALRPLSSTTDYEASTTCDLINGATTENSALNLKILRQVDAGAKANASLVTDTLWSSIAKLGAPTRRALLRAYVAYVPSQQA
jgi:3-hydroxybutyryl-CoA dehydrogenase